MIKRLIMVILFILICLENVYAVSALKLPFIKGESWRVDQGNATDPLNKINGKETNPTHRLDNTMIYAWDFNYGSGDDDLCMPILAPASGIISRIALKQGNWGNVIVVNYGNGSYGKFAHVLNSNIEVGGILKNCSIPVVETGFVKQGQIIAYVGGTGGWLPHIHYQTQNNDNVNGKSVVSTFSDVDVLRQNSDGIPTQGRSYVSDNHLYPVGTDQDGTFNQSIYNAFKRNGGYDKLGIPFNNGGGKEVHNWQGVLIQDFQHPDCPGGICPNPKPQVIKYHGDDGQTAIVYNPAKDQAFLLRDGFWGLFKLHGPSFFGAPKSNEYVSNYSGSLRQDFESGVYMVWDTTGITIYSSSGSAMFYYANNEISGRKTIGIHILGCYTIVNCKDTGLNFDGGVKITSPNSNPQSSVSPRETDSLLERSFYALLSLFTPSVVSASVGTAELELSVALPMDTNVSYIIEAYRNSEYAFTIPAGTTTTTDTGLIDGQEYCYEFRYLVEDEIYTTFTDKQCAIAGIPTSTPTTSTTTPPSGIYNITNHNTPNITTENSVLPIDVFGVYGGQNLADITASAKVTVSGCDSGSINSNNELVTGPITTIYEECKVTTTYGAYDTVIYVKVQSANGCILNVPSTTYPTIQSGIDDAYEGCLVLVAPGTYYENLRIHYKNISLVSSGGALNTIIDGSSFVGGRYGSVIAIEHSGKKAPLVIDGFTLRKGKGTTFNSTRGGGIYMHNSSPLVKNCIITDNILNNYYGYGAGVYFQDQSMPVFDNCIISNNHVLKNDSNGGGIYSSGSSFTLINSVVENNSAGNQGGGIDIESDIYDSRTNSHISPIVINTDIDNNEARYSGGGIHCMSCGLVIENSRIRNNKTIDENSRGGGGVFLYGSRGSSITGSQLTGNSTANAGGGLLIYGGEGTDIVDTIFENNVAHRYRGGNLNIDSRAVVYLTNTFVDKILTNFPEFYYNFDRIISGFVIDWIGPRANGILYGPMLVPTTLTGDGLAFNGVVDYVQITPGIQPQEFTIEALVSTTSTTGQNIIFSSGGWGIGGCQLGLTNGQLYSECMIGSATNAQGLYGTNSGFNDGSFHHVAASVRNQVLTLYVDGIIEGSLNLGGPIFYQNNQPWHLGKRGYGDQFFTGIMDEVSFYTTPLTDQEVLEHSIPGGPYNYNYVGPTSTIVVQ